MFELNNKQLLGIYCLGNSEWDMDYLRKRESQFLSFLKNNNFFSSTARLNIFLKEYFNYAKNCNSKFKLDDDKKYLLSKKSETPIYVNSIIFLSNENNNIVINDFVLFNKQVISKSDNLKIEILKNINKI